MSPAGATERWPCFPAPRSPGCSGRLWGPLWWWPYSGRIHMYGCMVVITWRWSVWPGVSGYPSPWFPSGLSLIWKIVGSYNVVWDRHPNNYFFPLRCEENFIQCLLNVWGGICIKDSHDKNAVCTLFPQVLNVAQKNKLLFIKHQFLEVFIFFSL